jgi:hypothetical protein
MEAISRHQKRMDFSFFSILQGAFEHQHLLQQAARPASVAPPMHLQQQVLKTTPPN